MAHYPVIQEVDELLAKGAIEPSTTCPWFYSDVVVVPKHTSGLLPILNLNQFHYMHTPTFKIPSMRQVWQLIQ